MGFGDFRSHGFWVKAFNWHGITPIMENQMTTNMDNEMEKHGELVAYSDLFGGSLCTRRYEAYNGAHC